MMDPTKFCDVLSSNPTELMWSLDTSVTSVTHPYWILNTYQKVLWYFTCLNIAWKAVEKIGQ